MKSGGTAAFWKGPRQMPITDLLERNHKLYGGETALVEINPEFTVDDVKAATACPIIVAEDLKSMID